MCDIELYQQMLGLAEPWTVTGVELSVDKRRVDVYVGHPRGVGFGCPEDGCGHRQLPVRDHSDEREWRHLDSMQFLTFLHARPPRVECPAHGVRQVRLPWAEPWSRFTLLFERLAIDVLKECSVEAAAWLLRISWDEAWHPVARGLAAKPVRPPARVGWTRRRPGGARTISPW